MLNKNFIKLFVITLSVFTFSLSHAQDLEIKPKLIKIRKPFTSSGIAFLNIQNNSKRELVITKLSSPQARYVKLYRNQLSDFGFPEKKEVKTVNLRANNTTQFAEGRYQIVLAGLKPESRQYDEIELLITFEDKGTFRTKLPISF